MSPWIEAMRLRTLPVSLAGVVAGVALAAQCGPVHWGWAAVCFAFALLAQIASNFANEYFDYRAGIDTPDRQGPQRSVSLGLISPRDMLRATLLTLALACAIGLLTLLRGGWWLLPIGIAIALGAMAYSAGPYPLSRHCLGEVAVVIFFGLVPVCLTFYLQRLYVDIPIFLSSLGVGLMGAMVILVNNYRDIATDRATGKHTLSTRLGPQGSAMLYLALGQFAAIAMLASGRWELLPILPAMLGFAGSFALFQGLDAAKSTRLLAITALTMLLTTLLLCVC